MSRLYEAELPTNFHRRTLLFAPLALASGCAAPTKNVRVATVRRGKPWFRLLEYYDQHFDTVRNMLLLPFASPGYHSRIEGGSPVHPVRESFIYALALLQRGNPSDQERAAAILKAVLPLQDKTPGSPTCGVWPWLLEESLAEMDAPDLNWADFCGASAGHIVTRHSTQLPPPLLQNLKHSLKLAAQAIRRRDVKPGYTNIAIMGGGVCVVAGEQLQDNALLDYGRKRLESVVQFTQRTGGFNEYNSPPYAKVVIAECERTLQLAKDLRARTAAETIRFLAWETVARSFHLPTQQWAGPHSRNSRVRLRTSSVEFIRTRTGAAITPHPTMQNGPPRGYAVVAARRCPAHLLHHFQQPPTAPQQQRRTFQRDRSRQPMIQGVTWQDDVACLGSVNRSSFWTQRKPLIAYWRTDADPAVVFRVRFLHDGRDFASMGLNTQQLGPRVLAAIHSLTGQGDWHPSLDRPAKGVFSATDLRLRCELLGEDAQAKTISHNRFSLQAGSRKIVLHTPPASFAGAPVVWQPGQSESHAYVDAVFYAGEKRNFNFSAPLPVNCALGIELLHHKAEPATHAPQINRRAARWRTNGALLQVKQTP